MQQHAHPESAARPVLPTAAHLLLLPLAALISSSARHSAMVLMLRKADSRAPVVISQMAWFTRRSGDTSTAWRRTTPALPIRVASSRGPLRDGSAEEGETEWDSAAV